MRNLGILSLIALIALTSNVSAVSANQRVGLRIRVGLKDQESTDWSGSIKAGDAKVESIRGWRWMPGDGATGAEWTLMTRRAQPQGAQRPARLPMMDNGVIVTLASASADQTIDLEFKPGKAQFKLSDLPYGKKLSLVNDGVEVERVPPVDVLAETNADEDYPAVATAKDGTIYLAYLAFTHGKDFQGTRERPATPESAPVGGALATGAVKKIEKPEDLDYLAEPAGGEQIYLRICRNGKWEDPIPVTDGKAEFYRPAVALDGSGRVWVFYSLHVDTNETLDQGDWELMAQSFDAKGKNPGKLWAISHAPGSDFMPAAATDSDGKVWVTWVGNRGANFNVFVAHQDGDHFSDPQRVTDSAANEWEPAIAADANGHLAVAWDTYAKGDYDVYLATRGADGKIGPAQPVAATLAFEIRPSLAYDNQGRLWVAWEESGDQWGKDFGALKKKGIPLYQGGRAIAVRTMSEDGKWQSPPDLNDAVPSFRGRGPRAAQSSPRLSNPLLPCFPRIAVDSQGQVWVSFRGRSGPNWRVAAGSVWCEYVTRLEGDAWSDATWLPRSNNLLDNRPALVAAPDGLTIVYSGDGRGEMNPPKLLDPHFAGTSGEDLVPTENATESDDAAAPATQPAQPAGANPRRPRAGRRAEPNPVNTDLFVTRINASEFAAAAGKPALKPFDVPKPATPSPDTDAERTAIAAMREYRINLNGESLRIWRGEFHRHTEQSFDGGNDGGLLDMWRYAIDAAGLDWIGDGDHDYGNGREYGWWTTQKAVTIFTIPEHFTPVFSYERSVGYPEGHRNCMFAQRGVRSLPRLPLSNPNKFAPAPDTNLCYMYLKRFHGLCAPHTSATNMGTDWRNHDEEVEPFVEIYQGDRNNYERPDAPRSAVTEAKLKQSTPEQESLGGWQPKGFVNLALKMGYRFAFEASSDHISTHLSYCNVLISGEPTREAILDAIRKRRVYGATDNIIADVRCKAGNVDHLMGEEFSTAQPPTLNIHLIGAQKIAKVTIIKDDEEVNVITPNQQDVSFTWTDPKPEARKTSYYYVRGEQVPDMEGVSSGELVWASPMWIKYEPK